MKKIFLAATVLATVFGCKPKSNEIKVALAIPLTGDIASLGQGIKRAVVLAIEEANASGKFSTPIVLESFDDRSDPKEAVSVANRIASDPAFIGIVGHFNSGCSIPASSIYAQANLPMLTPASSNPALTEQQLSPNWKWPRLVFRANPTDSVQGPVGANYLMKDLKVKKVAVIHDKTSYGQGVAEEFKKKFEANGGTVTAFEGLQTGDRDFRSLLTRVKATGPEAIYFGGIFSEGGILVRQARDIGFKGPFMTTEANYDPAFIKVAGEAAEGAYVTFLGSPPDIMPTAKQFVENYKKRYPNEEVKSYDHYGYEVTSILLAALQKVGPDKAKIIEELHQMTYNGVVGETKFDEKGDTLNKTITIFHIEKGTFVPVSIVKGS